MSKIRLNGGFTLIPEGIHVFKITKVTYKENFGKLEIKMQTTDGKSHTERFTLTNGKGVVNDGAMNAFSYFAKKAMNDSSLTEIDHGDLVGRYIRCEVTHDIQPNKNKPGETITFLRLGEKEAADGFDTATASTMPTSVPETTTTASSEAALDLKALLG